MSHSLYSMAFGVGTKNRKGEWLEVFYAAPLLNPAPELVAQVLPTIGYTGGNQAIDITTTQAFDLARAVKAADEEQAALLTRLAESSSPLVATIIASDEAPKSTPEAYLKLHLLSHCLVKPQTINLKGIFSIMPTVAWTNLGAIDLSELKALQLEERLKGRVLQVNAIDKLPKMTDYVIPKAVRIADAVRVRLGAYLGEKTTVMHEGFINFNAGTEGPNMVEGRISSGVFVGKGSDLGGGCSTMGVLSGGGNIVITVGENTLIGANAGIAIPLGNNCTVEAGLYITAGTKVTVLTKDQQVEKVVKAKELGGVDNLTFRRNSETGRIECIADSKGIQLNEELHQNN